MPDLDVLVTEGPDVSVTVEDSEETVLVEVTSLPAAVEVQVPGPAGPMGPAGPQGPAGASGDLYYVHAQVSASATWTITHSLGKYASVTVVDSGQNIVEGDVQYIDTDSLVVAFSVPFSGNAYLN